MIVTATKQKQLNTLNGKSDLLSIDMLHDYILSTLIGCISCKNLKYITRHTGEQISNLHSPDP